jgi:hypothetical protein
MLRRRFKDPCLVDWFNRIVDSYEKTLGRGLPIGSLTSQHFANFYLDPLDRLLTQRYRGLKIGYVRYMDDFVFWADDKEELLALRREVEGFVECELGLALKREPFINCTRRGMDSLGMRIFPKAVRLGRTSRVRYRRKIKAYRRAFEQGEWSETLLGGERTRAYATMRRTKMYDISIFFAKDGKMWTYVYSRDVDGKFDRRVLGNIGKNHLPRVASFVDCSSEKRFQKKSRVVCKLIRELDWKLLDDKSIGKLLEDYNWFAEELQHIGLFED